MNNVEGNIMKKIVLCVFIIMYAASSGVAAKNPKIYKWVDADGKVHYGDKPVTQSDTFSQEILNEQAIKVGEIGRVKTADEIEAEREAREMSAALEREKEKRKNIDDMILKTFSNEDEVIMMRDGKIAIVSSQQSVAKDRLDAIERELDDVNSKIEAIKKNNRAPGEAIVGRKTELQASLVSARNAIAEAESRKKEIMNEFEGYLLRFRELAAEGRINY